MNKRIIDTIEHGLGSFYTEDRNGICITYFNAHYDVDTQALISPISTWFTGEVADELDKLYYLEHSGEKPLSITYRRFLKIHDDDDNFDVKNHLFELIVSKFADKWNRLYDVLVSEHYSPLENYDMTQTETPDITKTHHHEENTDMSVENKDVESKNSLFGYNDANAEPTTKAESSGTTQTTGDVDDNYFDETDTETGTRSLTRHGNIGVTTSQQMLLSEVDLREKINFYEIVMNDMDSILSQLVY